MAICHLLTVWRPVDTLLGSATTVAQVVCSSDYIGNTLLTVSAGAKQEVGYLNNGKGIVSSGSRAAGVYLDHVARLTGPNSIIGRSIVIHHPDTGARIAQCVIGWSI